MVQVSEMIAAINTSITGTELTCDTLVGHFVQRKDTLEYGIKYDYYTSCNHKARDFCVLEKQDCSVSETSEPPSLKCPKTGRNKRCEKFLWSEINSEEEVPGQDPKPKQFCVALDTYSNASHDIDSCGNYAASRLWFQKSNEQMFNEITRNFKGNQHLFFHLEVEVLIEILFIMKG